MLVFSFIFIINFCSTLLIEATSLAEISQQSCTDTCQFSIQTSDIGKWPSDKCQNQAIYEVCKVWISVTYESNTASIMFQPYNNSTNPDDEIPDDVKGILTTGSVYTYWIPDVKPTFSVTYRCRTNENMCDKKFITDNWSSIINGFKPDTIRPTLSALIYEPQSTAGRCYVDEQKVEDCRGYCSYSYNNYILGPTYTCLATAGPNTPVQVNFDRNRVQVGPNNTDHDTISFGCNKENCNNPSIVEKVKKLFDFKEPPNPNAATRITFTLCMFLSIFQLFLTQ